MKRVFLACFVVGCFQTAFGQEAYTPPCPAACTGPYSSARAPASESDPSGSDRLQHLLLASEHLEAAGLREEAAEVRRLGAEQRDALRKRLGALEAEVDRLRELLGESQVRVHVKVLEMSRSKLRKLGLDFATATGRVELGHDSPAGGRALEFNIVDDGEAVLGVLEALREDRLARVLAEPTLVTVSGRPASCHIGGEVPAPVTQEDGTVAVQFREYGQRIDLVPIVLEGGRMRLELRLRVGRIDPSQSVEVDGQTCPGLQVHEVDTGVEMAAGQTLVVCGLVQKRAVEPAEQTAQADRADPVEEEVELLFLVTPELLGSSERRLTARCTGQSAPHWERPLPPPRTAPRPSPLPATRTAPRPSPLKR